MDTFSFSNSWLFILFGLPTWALVDGTWASLSQLAEHLPEGYNISAYLILSLTLGNIFPILIGYIMEKSHSQILLVRLIYFILVTGFITGILMGIVWEYSVTVSGTAISLPLMLLFFIVGACSSSSNVTHYMYVSTYLPRNTTDLGTGMGVGSMISGILGILQGVWLINYGFSTTIYYITLSLLYLPAMLSFYRLKTSKSNDMTESKKIRESASLIANLESNPFSSFQESSSSSVSDIQFVSKENLLKEKYQSFFTSYFPILLLQLTNSALGYGFVPALISYACGKFPNANTILLFSTGLSAIIDPCFRFFTNYYRFRTFQQLLIASAVLVGLALGLIICSSLSPSSSFYTNNNGCLPVLCYISFNSLFGFTNISIFRYFKEEAILVNLTTASSTVRHQPQKANDLNAHGDTEEKEESLDYRVQHAYRYIGIASQAGALLGSILAFSLVVSSSL